jgi:hypothetical protein
LRFFSVVLALSGFASPAWAFSLGDATLSSLRGWQATTLAFRINDSQCGIAESEMDALVDESLAVWNSAPGAGIRLERGERVSTSGAEIVGLTSERGAYILCDANLSSTMGFDTQTIGGIGRVAVGDGTVVHGYLLLNATEGAAAYFANLSRNLRIAVLSHEIGHVLGLGHSEDTAALMYYAIRADRTPRLAADDIDAITYLYPRREPFTNGPFGCGSLANYTTGSGEPPGPAGFLLLVALSGACLALSRFWTRVKWFRAAGDA